MARMNSMSAIAEDLKVIALMARGEEPFDAEAARAAAASIAAESAQIEALFTEPEDDPKSEAKPSIWENFAQFSSIAAEMEAIALGLSTSIQTSEDIRPALASLGQSCRTCHEAFRE
ncbi:c-type cytochrome [Yoonia litorea]|nr:cytochrome c [Yoonia litorea]